MALVIIPLRVIIGNDSPHAGGDADQLSDLAAEDRSGLAAEMLKYGSRTEKKLTDIVRERRATPAFSTIPVDDDDLQAILAAGLEAPSSYNLQPWRFVVVRDLGQRRRLRMAAMNQAQVEDAPVVIVACGDTRGWTEDLEEILRIGRSHGFDRESLIDRKRKRVTDDLGSQPNIGMWVAKQTMIAATTMMWVAEALGYDTGPMEGFDEDQVRKVLGIPGHVRVICLLAIGRLQGEDGRHPGRFPASRTVFGERYGEPLDSHAVGEPADS